MVGFIVAVVDRQELKQNEVRKQNGVGNIKLGCHCKKAFCGCIAHVVNRNIGADVFFELVNISAER